MSFNLAFWIGPAPANNEDAAKTFDALCAKYLDGGDGSPPDPALRAFVDEITRNYPDLTELDDDHIDEGVWSDGPLLNNAIGPLLYLGIVWSRAEEVTAYLVDRARVRGLRVFDPQSGSLLT